MISMDELLNHKYKLEDQSLEIQANLAVLLDKANKFRTLWGKPLIVTSGLRLISDQLRIYADKGITDKSKIPMQSKHLFGQACDLADPDGSLKEWVGENMDKMIEIGLWFEDFGHCPGWIHIQTVPYGSWVEGKSRTFIP